MPMDRLTIPSGLHQALRDAPAPLPERDPTIRESLCDVLRLLRQTRQSLSGLDYKVLGISGTEKGEVATESTPHEEPLVAIVQQLGELASSVGGVADALNKKL